MTTLKPVNPEDRRVVNIFEAPFTPFVHEDGRTDGDAVLQLQTDVPLGIGFHVYRMPAGLTTRPHEHNGDEQFPILEGELIENDGTHFKKGDLVWMRGGTQHCSYSPNGCLLAVHIVGVEKLLD